MRSSTVVLLVGIAWLVVYMINKKDVPIISANVMFATFIILTKLEELGV